MFTGGSLVQIVDASCKMFRYVKPTSVSIPNISKVQSNSGFTFLWVVNAYLFLGPALLKETRPAWLQCSFLSETAFQPKVGVVQIPWNKSQKPHGPESENFSDLSHHQMENDALFKRTT